MVRTLTTLQNFDLARRQQLNSGCWLPFEPPALPSRRSDSFPESETCRPRINQHSPVSVPGFSTEYPLTATFCRWSNVRRTPYVTMAVEVSAYDTLATAMAHRQHSFRKRVPID